MPARSPGARSGNERAGPFRARNPSAARNPSPARKLLPAHKKNTWLPLILLLACCTVEAHPVTAQSCTQTAGPKQARIYVDQCLAVSPATRPPCNAANPCDLITDEIQRGCAMLAKDAPAFCRTNPPPR